MAFVWSCASSPSRVMMSKSHPKSLPKSRKRSLSRGKHGGLAAKAPREERKPAATTVKEQKPLHHYVLEFFLLLWKLGRMLISSGPREKKEEPSLSSERPDAASSSSALATSSGVSVAAKRASEEQTEGPAAERLSFGTDNDKDPCHAPNSTGNSNEASKLDPEVLESVFSSNGIWVGDQFFPDQVGYRKLKKEEAEISMLKRLPVIEEAEINSERPGSDGGYQKKEHDNLKEENDNLKKEREVFDNSLQLRQVLSNFEKKPEGKIMIDGIKEVLKLPAAKSESIDRIIRKVSYTRILRAMHFQGANMTLKSNFWSIDWREHHRFPKFSNDGADYQWWEQNFDPEILEKRLEILRVAAKNWNPKLDMFMIIKLVSDLNSKLHPQTSENELNEKDLVKMFRLLTTICDLGSGGDSKI